MLLHITLAYGKSNVALPYLQNEGGRRNSTKVITIFIAEGKEMWQNHAMVLKAPDRETEGIISTYVLFTKASHIDRPDINGRGGIIPYQQ